MTERTADRRHQQRLRALSKYYCATTPSSLTREIDKVKSQGGGTIDASHIISSYVPNLPQVSRDPILTALAQLAAFRLDCQRSFISIIDDRIQHIIAEATRSVSAFDTDKHAPSDELLLGTQSLPIGYGVCPLTIDSFVGTRTLQLDEGSRADQSCVAIKDLLTETITRHAPSLSALPPLLRYYLEVPLKTGAGHVIGSICVVDSEARKPNSNDVETLQEMSQLVMNHLESVRMQEDHRRAEQLLEGLGYFVRGKNSLSGGQASLTQVEDGASSSNQVDDISAERISHTTPGSSYNPLVETARDQSEYGTGTSRPHVSTSINQSSESASSTASEVLSEKPGSFMTQTSFSSTEADVQDSELSHGKTEPKVKVPSPASVKTNETFSRASTLIRESMDLDAICFLELPLSHRDKNVESRGQERGEHTFLVPVDNDSSATYSFDDTPRAESQTSLRNSLSPTPADDVLCHRLGFSVRPDSLLASDASSQRFLTMPVTLLDRLTSRYPKGHIIHLDHSKAHVLNEVTSQSPLYNDEAGPRRPKTADWLSECFPHALSLLFFPLQDENQRTYATLIGLTSESTRSIQNNELSYVAAFANSIMCEVMRLEAVATDTAKSNFISSMSHELRSPLHGILAASQLLAESRSYPHQTDFLQMIDTCARTLLDVMDHLLEHAKINHLDQRQTPQTLSDRPNGRQGVEPGTHPPTPEMDLLSVVEETIASMVASSCRSMEERYRSDSRLPPSNNVLGISTQEIPAIPVLLEATPRTTWSIQSEPGSWRRIIMNLVGNSLKYTHSGQISVSLKMIEHTKLDFDHMVELKVVDTGGGISREYIKHRLFTPFAQENNLSAGAGLGLSLVQKIVRDLGGDIDVESEVGQGTTVIVRIPVKPSLAVYSPLCDDRMKTLLSNKSIGFFGFHGQAEIANNETNITGYDANARLHMHNLLASMAKEWFNISVTSELPNIKVVEDSFLAANIDHLDVAENDILIVSLNGRAISTSRLQHANYVRMSNPVGPTQMARVLRSLLEVRDSGASGRHINSTGCHAPVLGDTESQASKTFAARPDLSNARRPTIFDADEADLVQSSATPNVLLSINVSEHISIPSNHPADVSATTQTAILLVDDNEINLRILVACITRLSNVELITAVNGREALERYRQAIESGRKVSVVFMDISMPVMDGCQSTREIRKYEKARCMAKKERARIIALTGLASADAQHEIGESGFDVYLKKPVNLNKVRQQLTEESAASGS